MNTRLHVGHLAATTTETELQALFSPYGNVAEVSLPNGRGSGLSRTFAIVKMATPQGARAAIQALNGKEVGARALTVTEHLPGK
jgi:RNA recognition motif-containing protein